MSGKEQSTVDVWSDSKTEDRMCIMLTDVTRGEVQRLIDGRRSRIRTKLKQVIDQTDF